MAQYSNPQFIRFLLREVHPVRELFQYERFAHLDEEQVDMLLDAAKAFADRHLFPFFKEMDEQPVHYQGDGVVWSHPQLKQIIAEGAEQGWISGAARFEQGGLQLPEMVFNAAHHFFQAANNGAVGYLLLTAGAAGLINNFGSVALQQRFVPQMYSGAWQGTMALTEPQAGSSLSDITTSARPDPEGFYRIKGQKIFISGGQHLACENFVHLTLARIEGAPPGTKGISLFVVPKFRPEADGALAYNDVFCAGDYQKLGQRAYVTTHLVFGEQDDCRGWLVGEPHKGLQYMFQMMNEARISVGQVAASVSMAAYHAALQYAQERPQGRPIGAKDLNQPPTLIIKHPDVQRMLLTQKAIVEGSMSLIMECYRLYDLHHATEGAVQRRHWLLLEILTPIAKTYASEQGNRATSLAIQVLGGYGYTMDFTVQQYYRDLRIMALYEGTTGIQSLDLLGRKVLMEQGQALQLLVEAMQQTIAAASRDAALQPYAEALQKEVQRTGATLQQLGQLAAAGDLEGYLADATVFMEMAGLTVIAWQWLKMAVCASEKLAEGGLNAQTTAFYEGKIHTMRFFFRYELPHAAACAKTLSSEGRLTTLKDFFEW
jgi:butyryl-CoA dehydrogenase